MYRRRPHAELGRFYSSADLEILDDTGIKIIVSHISQLVSPWISPVFATLSKTSGNYQSLVTRASQNEGEVTEEVLNQILATVENDSKSAKEICTAYIEKLCRAGNLSDAVQLLQSLRDKNIYLRTAYNCLLVAAAERNDMVLSIQILKDLLVSSRSLSAACYINFARSFTKTNDCTQLVRFVEEVMDITFLDSIIVVNRIIFAFAESRQIEKALVIFDHIKGLKCKPDLITYNTVLDILGRVGRVNEMLQEFASMKEAGIAPDFISYNTLLNSLRKIGRLDLCSVYFQEMGESGINPDLLTYTALIESFGRSGYVEESLRLFSDMKQRQIRPSIYVYRSLINNLKKMGKVDLAMTLLEEMNSSLSDLAGPKDFKRKARW
ncbi:Pentatricopeptide repeat-containing protein [Melia azedarach]|uniref:Pentatricopeptide repeat-containing protein n=1 Tax=Melia azedarach TaxID=155640 RepID=A0ACC1Z2B6_MELAZ|nr:Pentatricopeptide repeat-containing protein [Melia azedarach]